MSEEEHVSSDTPAPATAAKESGSGLHKVRATNRPDVELEVDDRELADLRAMGLLVSDEKKGR